MDAGVVLFALAIGVVVVVMATRGSRHARSVAGRDGGGTMWFGGDSGGSSDCGDGGGGGCGDGGGGGGD